MHLIRKCPLCDEDDISILLVWTVTVIRCTSSGVRRQENSIKWTLDLYVLIKLSPYIKLKTLSNKSKPINERILRPNPPIQPHSLLSRP